MKRILFSFFMVLFCNFAMAQLNPPLQVDTCWITSVKYHYTDIDKEYWPCTYIQQSSSEFVFGDKHFAIIGFTADYFGMILTFTVVSEDGNEYNLVQNTDQHYIEFSGYRFTYSDTQPLDQHPLFRGGDVNAFSEWVNSHLTYPKLAKECGVQGRVLLQFTIDANGEVKDVKVLRGVDPSLDKEAIRVVSMSPKWTPGKIGDENVSTTYTFPVIFQLR